MTATVSAQENNGIKCFKRFNVTSEWGRPAQRGLGAGGGMDSMFVELSDHCKEKGQEGQFQRYTYMSSSLELEIHHCYLFARFMSDLYSIRQEPVPISLDLSALTTH